MTIYGMGIDIIEINRIKLIVARTGDRLASRILTKIEWQKYKSSKFPIRFLAKRFAAKEAAAKAFGYGVSYGLAYNQFEIINDKFGKPMLHFFLNAAILIENLCILKMHISLTDDKCYACAVVIFEK
ncbi:holo-ACP synthase [Blochmannia endosymbiont of Colobopsis nipponica]|uniref:holo-ACP synthase n=1 Tax=Blochmannia endosymbiont of Colobopsis nipponica TaxID=2681987 RepID=UPI00177D31DA|nr:holo-ACP synthase [Blochmannia endosymbiont of Colobopsis nipponica]QOI10933.1 holo-ACP synthase [Blochmannia endosymbiont of Colobopsis nipponica]